jgi:hypothetical protein
MDRITRESMWRSFNLNDVHTQSGFSRKSILLIVISRVATTQMGDHSAQEPKKVVPSRDITPGRRKEPLNRGLPNGTSYNIRISER